MDRGESPLTEIEKAMVLESAKALELSGEIKMQEVVDFIIMEKVIDPVLVMKAITSHLHLLNKEVDCHHNAKAAGATGGEHRDTHSRQL
jgi:hypothetical protein